MQEVILLVLLLHSSGLAWLTSGSSHPDSLDPSRRVILEWLIRTAKSGNTENSKQEPPNSEGGPSSCLDGQKSLCEILWDRNHCYLLTKVSIRYFNFFKEHLKFLVHETEKLDSALNLDSQCLKREHSREMFLDNQRQMKWIVSQWVGLVQGGRYLRDVCIPVLKSHVFPNVVSDETLESKGGLYQEISHTGSILDYSLIKHSIWNKALESVILSMKGQNM